MMDYLNIFNGFIRSGDTVCELFYGNRPDLIPLLSLVVKETELFVKNNTVELKILEH